MSFKKKKKSDKIRKKTLEIYYYWKFAYNLCLRLSWATQYYTTIRWEVLWEDKVEGKYLNWLDLDEDSEEKQKEGKSYWKSGQAILQGYISPI